MPTTHTVLVFALISLGVVAVPGPSSLYVLTAGVAGGRRAALAAVAGIETASALRVLATVAGLSALLASSALAVAAIRWSGAAFLAALGVRALIGAPSRRGTRSGIMVGLGNPSMIVFFVAFFPRFVHAGDGSRATQILVLGGVFWVIGALWDLGIAWASGSLGACFARVPATRIEAAIFIALAAWTAIGGV